MIEQDRPVYAQDDELESEPLLSGDDEEDDDEEDDEDDEGSDDSD